MSKDSLAGIRGKRQYWWISCLLGAYFVATIATNLYLIPYPTDNDFQSIGWMAQHQTPNRLESYANANYPLGFPFLLAHLVPYFKTILHTVFFVQSLAMALAMFSVFAISMSLFGSFRCAVLSMVVAMILTIPVATSEFADGTAAALVLFGLWIVLRQQFRMPAAFVTGVLCGMAHLLRFHYLVLLGIVPVALSLSGRLQKRAVVVAVVAYVIGFLSGSSPALAINSIIHANPFWSGTSPYNPGVFAVGVDWNNYPNTYNLWPIHKLLYERPKALIWLLTTNSWGLLQFNHFWLGIPAALVLLRKSLGTVAANLRFIIITTVSYVLVTVLPKEVTDRVLLPATAVLAIVGVPAVVFLADSLADKVLRLALVSSICGLIVIQPRLPTWKIGALSENRQILQALRAAGMSQSSEVFCNDWQPYNLDDVYLTPFYDYGAYMLLDSEYRQQRPMPTASTLPDWNAFFANRRIRYIVIRRGTDLDYYVAEQERGGNWKILAETDSYRVFRILRVNSV